jgi:hypothetical protein
MTTMFISTMSTQRRIGVGRMFSSSCPRDVGNTGRFARFIKWRKSGNGSIALGVVLTLLGAIYLINYFRWGESSQLTWTVVLFVFAGWTLIQAALRLRSERASRSDSADEKPPAVDQKDL